MTTELILPSTEIRQTPQEIVNARRVVGGPSDFFRALQPRKYPWTTRWIEESMANHWTWNEPNLTRDVGQYLTLPDDMREMHDKALAFLSNLDSIQLGNLSLNIAPHVSCYEIQECINRQVWEEEIHVRSYSTLVETVCKDTMKIYDMYRHNPALAAKNDFIISQSNSLMQSDFNPGKFITACTANIALEGIYFFTGFLTMYAIVRNQRKMFGEREMIAYIQRDEVKHVELFLNVRQEALKENPDYDTAETRDSSLEVVEVAVAKEFAWGIELIGEGRANLTPEIMDSFTKHLGNKRCLEMGLPRLYDKKYDVCPVHWFAAYSTPGSTDTNFFESRPQAYQDASSALEW